ncbi:MAG TPA: putative metal-binding motif-containing protein [Patescibacteria group bacterium]|nr:putative metal-binding motif-containing protein [Patescibacteria group bacterium]
MKKTNKLLSVAAMMVLFTVGSSVEAQVADLSQCPLQAFRDADGDEYGDQTETICLRISGGMGVVLAVDGYVLDDDSANNDCDDAKAAVHPGVVETANAIDDNCDGQVDEGIRVTATPKALPPVAKKVVKRMPENTDARCMDRIDNDGDGKRDRDDPDCYISVVREVKNLGGEKAFSGKVMTHLIECRYYTFEYEECACEVWVGYEYPDTRCDTLKRYKVDD